MDNPTTQNVIKEEFSDSEENNEQQDGLSAEFVSYVVSQVWDESWPESARLTETEINQVLEKIDKGINDPFIVEVQNRFLQALAEVRIDPSFVNEPGLSNADDLFSQLSESFDTAYDRLDPFENDIDVSAEGADEHEAFNPFNDDPLAGLDEESEEQQRTMRSGSPSIDLPLDLDIEMPSFRERATQKVRQEEPAKDEEQDENKEAFAQSRQPHAAPAYSAFDQLSAANAAANAGQSGLAPVKQPGVFRSLLYATRNIVQGGAGATAGIGLWGSGKINEAVQKAHDLRQRITASQAKEDTLTKQQAEAKREQYRDTNLVNNVSNLSNIADQVREITTGLNSSVDPNMDLTAQALSDRIKTEKDSVVLSMLKKAAKDYVQDKGVEAIADEVKSLSYAADLTNKYLSQVDNFASKLGVDPERIKSQVYEPVQAMINEMEEHQSAVSELLKAAEQAGGLSEEEKEVLRQSQEALAESISLLIEKIKALLLGKNAKEEESQSSNFGLSPA